MPALTAPSQLPEGIVAATKGSRALVIHAWRSGTKWWTSLCEQEQIAIGSNAFCRHDSLDAKGRVGCDLCRAALRGEVNPHAKAHELPPAAEKKQLAKLDAVEADEPAPAGACAYLEDKELPGVCSRCGTLKEDHDVRKVPGADKALEDAGACGTCALPLRRLGEQVQHLQTNGVLATKGRGGCKTPKLADPVKATADQLQARVDAGERVTAKDAAAAFGEAEPAGRTKGYKARPAAFEPPTPQPAWVASDGCSPRCQVLHEGRPHEKADEHKLATAFKATAPEMPKTPAAPANGQAHGHGMGLHQAPEPRNGLPRGDEGACGPACGVAAPNLTAPIGSREWMKASMLQGLDMMRAEILADNLHEAHKTATVLAFVAEHALQRAK